MPQLVKVSPDRAHGRDGRIRLLSPGLMAEAVFDGASVSKTACGLAAALEEVFIKEGWPAGRDFGLQSQLCRRFGVSRRVFLEAVRVLTTRGTARLARGHDPALIILKPDRELLSDMLSGHGFLRQATSLDRTQTLHLLERVKARTQAPGSAAITEAIDFLGLALCADFASGTPARNRSKSLFVKTRAGRIANYFIEEYGRGNFTPGQRIFSLQDISDAYAADRSIARQAVRLMESSGLFSSLPGRGNGVIVTEPLPGPVCRALCCYYASLGMSVADALDLFHAVSVEAIMMCARMSDAADVARARHAMADWQARSPQLRSLVVIENAIFEAIANPMIDLILRSVRGYNTLKMDVPPETLRADMAERFIEATRQTIDAIARRDVAGAGRLHEQKLMAMRCLPN